MNRTYRAPHDRPAKLETVGLFSGAVRLLAQTELDQQRSGAPAQFQKFNRFL